MACLWLVEKVENRISELQIMARTVSFVIIHWDLEVQNTIEKTCCWPYTCRLSHVLSTTTQPLCRHEAMKSERKQIQESNLLADKIEAQIIKFKQALPAILAITVVAVVGLLGYGIYSHVQENQSAKGWTALYFSDTVAENLTKISSDFEGTSAALWARQTAGDAFMSQALEKVYLDRTLSDQFYKQAANEYQVVADKCSDPFLKARSLYGLAQAAEGVGDREKASSLYRKVSLVKGISPEFATESTKRAAWLDSKAGEEFYEWFKSNRPTAPVLMDNPPSKFTLPGSPDFKFPNLPGAASPGATAPNNDLPVIPMPSGTAPAPETQPGVPTLPDSSSPASEASPTPDPVIPGAATPDPTEPVPAPVPEQPAAPGDKPVGDAPKPE